MMNTTISRIGCATRSTDDEDDGDLAVLFWPLGEFEALLSRWPALIDSYGTTWEGHRDAVEQAIQTASRAGLTVWRCWLAG